MTPRTFVAARFTAVSRSVRSAAGSVWPFIFGAGADLIILAGVAAMAYGIGLIAKPAAFIFVGLVLIVIGVRGAQPEQQKGGEQ